MKIFKLIVILFLLTLILGGVGLFYYQAFWRPHKLLKQEGGGTQQQSATATPTPDYTLTAFDKAMSVLKSGDVTAGRQALLDFLIAYPQSSKIADAKKALGNLNTTDFFSPASSADKTVYTVVRGDSLVRIASKFKTSAELIFQVNNLMNINLQIGQELTIPQPDMSILVDRKNRTLTLLNHGQFFKEYPIVSLKAINLPSHGTFQSKVMDKFAMHDGKRVAFGDKNYFGGERWVSLSQAGLMIRSVPAGTAESEMPPGVVLAAPDAEEMFALINRGTPITIQ